MGFVKRNYFKVLISTGFWCILNESFSLSRVIEGLVIAILCVVMIANIFIDDKDPFYHHTISGVILLKYICLLFFNIYKNAFILIAMILFGRPSPTLQKFRTQVKNQWGRCLLGNAITLTPGTVTLNLKRDELNVLCISTVTAKQIQGGIEKILY